MYIQGVRHKYLKRTFLAPASTGLTSYILAEIEDTRNGEYRWGNNLLTIGDCRRRIQLEFALGTAKSRRESLRKADLLMTTVLRFAHALWAECQLIEKFEQAATESKKKGNQNARIQKARNGKDSRGVRKNAKGANRKRVRS